MDSFQKKSFPGRCCLLRTQLSSQQEIGRFSFVTHTERWLTAQELGFVSISPGICRNCGSIRKGWSWRHVVLLNISSMNEIFCQNKNETRKKSGSSNVWLGKGQFPQRREKRPDKSTGRKVSAEPCAKATALAMERGKVQAAS